MIGKLKIKIIVVIMIILSLTVLGIMASIIIVSQEENQWRIENRLRRIADNDGVLPKEYDSLDAFHDSQSGYIDSFSIQVDRFYEVRKIILSRNILVEQETIIQYANEALSSGRQTGELGSYAFKIRSRPYGMIIVFVDVTPYQESNQSLMRTTVITGLSAILIFLIISIFLAGWLVKPVSTTLEKQKRFISDASHELKTPLAVISTNTDVLEAEIGDNKWLGYIRSESSRMSELVNELLCLARLDDKTGHKLLMSPLDLSAIVLQTALPFESTAFELGKHYSVDVQPNVGYVGDESTIKHVISILIDNAIKYSAEHGEISVRLYTHASKRIIEVYNTGEGVPKDRLSKIFERFHREDEARNSKSGGYGLGLAIAKSSVEAHGGKIFAKSEYGSWIRFTVVL